MLRFVPVNFTDPTGHYSCNISFNEVGVCVDAILSYEQQYHVEDMYGQAKAIGLPNYPNNSHGGTCDSTFTLADCFGDSVSLKDFSTYGPDNPISITEFEELADEIAYDLYIHDLTWPGWVSGRGAYDTPFYNNGLSERRQEEGENGQLINPEYWPADQQVCIETLRCSGRSEINYIAQGMWGAAVGEPRPVSRAIAFTWKLIEYFSTGQ